MIKSNTEKQDIKKTKLWNKVLPIVLFAIFTALWITTIVLCFLIPVAAAIMIILLGLLGVAAILLIMWQNKKGFWNKEKTLCESQPVSTSSSKADTSAIDI